MKTSTRKYVAEGVGTFVLVFGGVGSALFVGHWALSQLWMFVLAPVVGAVIAAGVHKFINSDDVVISVRDAETALESQQNERAARA
jgi:aquaporin Z